MNGGLSIDFCSGTWIKAWVFIGYLITIVKIAVPILLIVMGSIDFMKAVMAGKEDEIKKTQSTFIKRTIAALIVFFVPTILSILLTVLEHDEVKNNNCYMCVVNPSSATCEALEAELEKETAQDNTGDIDNNESE